MTDVPEPLHQLELGWQVTPALIPNYWLNPNANAGKHLPQDLVLVPGGALGCHTAIVAQSGSGKSFFLGRLIEEILLKTKAQCVVFDPNADFRGAEGVVSHERWHNPQYDYVNERGFLPTEQSQTVFHEQWSPISKNSFYGPQHTAKSGIPLVLSWSRLGMEFFSEDLDPMHRSDLFHCHEFVRAVVRLSGQKDTGSAAMTPAEPGDMITQSLALLDRAKSLLGSLRACESPQGRTAAFEGAFQAVLDVAKQKRAKGDRRPARPGSLRPLIGEQEVQQLVNRAVASVGYISSDVERYYFGKATEYVSHGIVRIGPHENAGRGRSPFSSRLLVCDLPSFPDVRTRHLAVHFILRVIWDRARQAWEAAMRSSRADTRVPTFIVLDEAHNLVRRDTESLADVALREQFRQIAAEGRKYGLFLILCTQRPDKIDPLIVSECENFAILKLGSRAVLEKTRDLFGLDDIAPSILSKCLDFRTGRAMLIGRWAGASPKLLYTAMRRTVEGGRSLRDEHWGIREPKDLAKAVSPSDTISGAAALTADNDVAASPAHQPVAVPVPD